MSENQLKPNVFYAHPLTLDDVQPVQVLVDAEGELQQIRGLSTPKRRESLTIEDIVIYYYTSVGINHRINFPRDCGGVKHLLKTCPLDVLLFAIDSLISDYKSSEVYDHPPMIINAQAFFEDGSNRRGDVLDIGRQYGNVPSQAQVLTLEQLGLE